MRQHSSAGFSPDSALTHAIVPALNVEPRAPGFTASHLILHYTGMASAARAIGWLSCRESRVSCHYVIDEAGTITQLVPENLRAWHAGVAFWNGITDLNSASIGIEIQNPGHEDGYHDFPPAQMKAVAALSRDIVVRHAITPRNVLAHSDVACARKVDPGEKFDWAFLHSCGVGHWVDPVPVDEHDAGLTLGASTPRVSEAQAALRSYGYGLEESGILDKPTYFALRAFQLHFRQTRVDGTLDSSTLATLDRLLASAKPEVA